MDFVIQLDESKKERGERVEDGTFQRDRALYEVFLHPPLSFFFLEIFSPMSK